MLIGRCTASRGLAHPVQQRLAVGPSTGYHGAPARSAALTCAARRFRIPTVFSKKEEEPGGDVYFSSEVADIDPAEVWHGTAPILYSPLPHTTGDAGQKQSSRLTSFQQCTRSWLLANIDKWTLHTLQWLDDFLKQSLHSLVLCPASTAGSNSLGGRPG